VPRSPRWLYLKNKYIEAKQVLNQIHGKNRAEKEISSIEKSIGKDKELQQVKWTDILKPNLRFIMIVGLVVGVLQQITGINAIYFYATSIFKQTGIGTDAAFSSGILLSSVTVLFTFIAMYLIDRAGRRPLLLVGTAGIAISLLLCAFGFSQATYQLKKQDIYQFKFEKSENLIPIAGNEYQNDVDFKEEMKTILGNSTYSKNDGLILEAATQINATLVLVGILGFIACFAFSLGPVMWVLLSELYPIKYRGIAIGIVAFVNSFISSAVQLVFPWELSNLGNAMSFFIFGAIAAVGFFVLLKILPETKGKSLEELETTLIK
jgi:SP family arabinose:H+ symporter-like MFS transporter